MIPQINNNIDNNENDENIFIYVQKMCSFLNYISAYIWLLGNPKLGSFTRFREHDSIIDKASQYQSQFVINC